MSAGYDASAKMSEETVSASRAAPWGIIHSVTVSGQLLKLLHLAATRVLLLLYICTMHCMNSDPLAVQSLAM